MMSDWLVSSASSSFNAVEIMPDVARHASPIFARFSEVTMFVLARKKRTISQPRATATPLMTINAIAVSKRIVTRIVTEPTWLRPPLTLSGRTGLVRPKAVRALLLIRQCQARTRGLRDTRTQQRHKRDSD